MLNPLISIFKSAMDLTGATFKATVGHPVSYSRCPADLNLTDIQITQLIQLVPGWYRCGYGTIIVTATDIRLDNCYRIIQLSPIWTTRNQRSEITEASWSWSEACSNPLVTWEIILNNVDRPWNWPRLSVKELLTPEIVQKHSDKPWDFWTLSRWMPWEVIEDLADKPWDWRYLSSKPSISPKFVEDHFDKPWDFGVLSRVMPREFIDNHPDKPWDGAVLSMRFPPEIPDSDDVSM